MHKVAILIDGAYLLKRLPRVCSDVDASYASAVADAILRLVTSHLKQLNRVHQASNPFQLLYRTFYYDARPYEKRRHKPISGKSIDFAQSDLAKFRRKLFEELRDCPNVSVRLGEVRPESDFLWTLNTDKQKELSNNKIQRDALTDTDFSPALTQKGVDMRIGLDIASITLKRQANIIILVSGDSDFVPAAKLARREGVQFILDPLWQRVGASLSEHIDRKQSGFRNPQPQAKMK